jgi:hypothetical protein
MPQHAPTMLRPRTRWIASPEITMHHADAFDRINRLHGSTRKLFDAYTQVAPPPSPLLLQKVLLALELRWKIEDGVLIPSLHGTQGVMQGGSEDAARELDALRRLAALARDDEIGIDGQRVLLCAIETLASLRSERINWALTRAQRAAMVDARALGREMDQLLEHWRVEFRHVGEIDAVGATVN